MAGESIDVVAVSLEEAEAQIAELWIGGEMFAHTLPDSGRLVLRIEPRGDGQAWEVDFRELRRALDQVSELLAVRLRPS